MRSALLLVLLLVSPGSAGAQQRTDIAGTYGNGPGFTIVFGADRTYAVRGARR